MQDNVISHYVTHPEDFKALTMEQQLAVLAEIVLYCSELEIALLREGYKERSVEVRAAHARTNYWKDIQMNIKKLAELETARIMKGI